MIPRTALVSDPSLNGHARPSRVGRFWPVAIFALLGMNAAIVAVTIVFASSDPSVAVEPDYYNKALNFEQTIQQRDTNARLGWNASAQLLAPTADATPRLCVRLTDRAGAPIDGADVDAVAFAVLRSGQRQTLTLGRTEPGVYTAPIALATSGKWTVRVTARLNTDTFTAETTTFSPIAP